MLVDFQLLLLIWKKYSSDFVSFVSNFLFDACNVFSSIYKCAFKKKFLILAVYFHYITLKLSTLKQPSFYPTVAVGFEFRNGSAGWLWLSICHEVAMQVSAGAQVTWRLDWHCRIHLQNGTLTRLVAEGLGSPPWEFL